jgi:hypothetical protein
VERAGAFSVVVECVPASLAARVTEALTIPTVGIGADLSPRTANICGPGVGERGYVADAGPCLDRGLAICPSFFV